MLDKYGKYKIEQTGFNCKLTASKITGDDEATFTCKATNSSGTTSKSCTVTIANKPKFVQELRPVSTKPGTQVEFSAQATGSPEPEVEWTLNDRVLRNRGRIQIIKEKNGKHSLVIEDCKINDSGEVSCRIVGSGRKAHTSASLTIIEDEVAPRIDEANKVVSDATSGDDITLEVALKGTPTPVAVWYKGDHVIENSDVFEITGKGDTSACMIKSAEPKHSGEYRVEVSNSAGTVSKTFTVNIKGKFVVINTYSMKQPDLYYFETIKMTSQA